MPVSGNKPRVSWGEDMPTSAWSGAENSKPQLVRKIPCIQGAVNLQAWMRGLVVAMAKGDIKAGKSTIIGSAGEYFVMGELLRRGWLAGLTPRGAPDFDIVATKNGRTIHVRVKTKTADSALFRWNRLKDGNVFRAGNREGDVCVLVDIGGVTPEYYVVPSKEVERQLLKFFGDWLSEKPGRDPENRVIAFNIGRAEHLEWLSNFKDNWAVLD